MRFQEMLTVWTGFAYGASFAIFGAFVGFGVRHVWSMIVWIVDGKTR